MNHPYLSEKISIFRIKTLTYTIVCVILYTETFVAVIIAHRRSLVNNHIKTNWRISNEYKRQDKSASYSE